MQPKIFRGIQAKTCRDRRCFQGVELAFHRGNRHMMNEVSGVNAEVEEDDVEEFEQDDDMVETVVIPDSESTDNVGDASVEINVEELIADIECTDDKVSARKKEVRRRLEELAEDNSLEDTYAIEFGED